MALILPDNGRAWLATGWGVNQQDHMEVFPIHGRLRGGTRGTCGSCEGQRKVGGCKNGGDILTSSRHLSFTPALPVGSGGYV